MPRLRKDPGPQPQRSILRPGVRGIRRVRYLRAQQCVDIITGRKRETFVVAGLAYNKRKFEGIYLARRDDMSYAGKVEHGFTLQTQRDLESRARGLATRSPPLSTKVSKPKARWLKPELLVDVEYRALTKEGKLRHPSFKA